MISPIQKMERLLEIFVDLNPKPGEPFFPYEDNDDELDDNSANEKEFTDTELRYYTNALIDRGYLSKYGNAGGFVVVTIEGYAHVFANREERENSINCFVAMSFDEEDKHIYLDGIKPAIEATGFLPFKVDEYNAYSEQTINDAILSGIKRSNFCIADFTKQKRGVYFEAAYALGRGLKVIYTCRNDYFSDTDFDTSNYPHILYDTPDELRQKLIYKIEAWIKA